MHTPESPAHATGVKVSRVVFGGNVLGWTADQATGFAMLDRLVDAGLTTIDTADVYSGWVPGHQGGESESVLGAWLRARGPAQRERVQIMERNLVFESDSEGFRAEWLPREQELSKQIDSARSLVDRSCTAHSRVDRSRVDRSWAACC